DPLLDDDAFEDRCVLLVVACRDLYLRARQESLQIAKREVSLGSAAVEEHDLCLRDLVDGDPGVNRIDLELVVDLLAIELDGKADQRGVRCERRRSSHAMASPSGGNRICDPTTRSRKSVRP